MLAKPTVCAQICEYFLILQFKCNLWVLRKNCTVNDTVHLSVHNMILWRNKLITKKSHISFEVFV